MGPLSKLMGLFTIKNVSLAPNALCLFQVRISLKKKKFTAKSANKDLKNDRFFQRLLFKNEL